MYMFTYENLPMISVMFLLLPFDEDSSLFFPGGLNVSVLAAVSDWSDNLPTRKTDREPSKAKEISKSNMNIASEVARLDSMIPYFERISRPIITYSSQNGNNLFWLDFLLMCNIESDDVRSLNVQMSSKKK